MKVTLSTVPNTYWFHSNSLLHYSTMFVIIKTTQHNRNLQSCKSMLYISLHKIHTFIHWKHPNSLSILHNLPSIVELWPVVSLYPNQQTPTHRKGSTIGETATISMLIGRTTKWGNGVLVSTQPFSSYYN